MVRQVPPVAMSKSILREPHPVNLPRGEQNEKKAKQDAVSFGTERKMTPCLDGVAGELNLEFLPSIILLSRHKIAAFQLAGVPLIQRVHGQSTQQLGIEIGGLLRHHLAGKRYFLQLLQRNRIREEGNIGLASPYLLNGLAGV